MELLISEPQPCIFHKHPTPRPFQIFFRIVGKEALGPEAWVQDLRVQRLRVRGLRVKRIWAQERWMVQWGPTGTVVPQGGRSRGWGVILGGMVFWEGGI